MTRFIFGIAAVCVVVLPACDSGEPEETAPMVSVVASLEDLVIDQGSLPEEMDLAPHFSADEDAGALSYAAAQTGAAVAVSISGSILTIRPVEAGESQIRVTASGARGGSATGSFTVSVRPTPSIEVVQPLDDRELEVEDAPLRIGLYPHFRGQGGAGVLRYSVEVSGDAVTAVIPPGSVSLEVAPVRTGTASIYVLARGNEGSAAADTFVVVVSATCPPSRPPGTSDYFPIALGPAGTFDETYSYRDQSRSYTRRDTLQLWFTSQSCSGGIRRVEAELRYPRSTETVQFVEDSTGVLHPWAERPFPRFSSALADTLPASNLGVRVCNRTGRAGRVELVRGVGLTRLSSLCGSASGAEDRNWVRLGTD